MGTGPGIHTVIRGEPLFEDNVGSTELWRGMLMRKV